MHEQLVQEAKNAIDRVHTDTKVGMRQTRDDLKDIRDHVDMLIDAVECSLAHLPEEKE